jgi:hypothetical protein
MESDKRYRLQSEFDHFNIQLDTPIDEDTFYHILDSKINGEYDRFTARQLFERSDYNKDRMITINEFINTWLEAEHVTLSKIQRENQKLIEISHTIDNFAQKINEQSQMGAIDQHKRFVFRILDIQDFSTPDPVFNISSNQYTSANVRFSEFQHGDSVIDLDEVDREIQILINPVGPHNAEGTLTIPLSMYVDQERHDKVFSVQTTHGSEAVLRMQGGIIYNQLQYYQKLLEQNRMILHETEDDLQDYNNTIILLHQPFPAIQDMMPYQDASNFMTNQSGFAQQNFYNANEQNYYGHDQEVSVGAGHPSPSRQFQGTTSMLNSHNFMDERRPQLGDIH